MSLALASILDRSVRIEKIRQGRSTPGLRAKHANGVQIVARISHSNFYGAYIASPSLTLSSPATVRDESLHFPLECTVGTAGATALVLQATLPVALRFLPAVKSGEATLTITGGTTSLFAPTSDFIQNVLVPNLALFGLSMHYDVSRHGFFPKGGGVCTIEFDTMACASNDADPSSRTG